MENMIRPTWGKLNLFQVCPHLLNCSPDIVRTPNAQLSIGIISPAKDLAGAIKCACKVSSSNNMACFDAATCFMRETSGFIAFSPRILWNTDSQIVRNLTWQHKACSQWFPSPGCRTDSNLSLLPKSICGCEPISIKIYKRIMPILISYIKKEISDRAAFYPLSLRKLWPLRGSHSSI